MSRARTKLSQGVVVSANRITLVIGEAVAGMTRVERSHQRIARDLRKNGSSRNTGGFRVAPDNRLLRDRYLFQTFRVDQEMLRDNSQAFNSPPHCENARPVDVDGVDLLDFDKRDRPRNRLFLDFLRKSLTRIRIQLF